MSSSACRTVLPVATLRTSVAADDHIEASHPLDVFTAELSPVGQSLGDIEPRVCWITHEGGRWVELDRVLFCEVVGAPRETGNENNTLQHLL